MKKWQPDFDWQKRLLFGEHHQSHAASAFFPSPFEEAAVLLHGRRRRMGHHLNSRYSQGNKLEMLREILSALSRPALFLAFTYYTGFKVNSRRIQRSWSLAPYSEPQFKDLILDKIVDLKDDGTFRLDQSYFDFFTGLHDERQVRQPVRRSAAPRAGELLDQKHMDRGGPGRHRGDRGAPGRNR